MTNEQDRLDRHHRVCRAVQSSIWGRAVASAGWEWDSYPHYLNDAVRDEARVILWHATTGRMISKVLPEQFLDQEILRVISGADGDVSDRIEVSNTKQQDADVDLLDYPIEHLDVSDGVRRALRKSLIRTIGELIEHREQDLLQIKGLGPAAIAELNEKLAEYDLTLTCDKCGHCKRG